MKKYPPRRAEFHDPASEVPRPIFGIDIDGTLGQYHRHFTNFAAAYLGRSLPDPEEFGGGSFATHLGLSKSTYRKIKLAYRRGGAKRSMPPYPGASELTRSLRSRGAIVVLCTTRPYLSLEGVDEDTRHWAKRNEVQHDFIIWGESKYRDLNRFGDRVVSVVDDEPSMLQQAMALGIKTNKVARRYNQTTIVNGYKCTYLSDVQMAMERQLNEWEKENR